MVCEIFRDLAAEKTLDLSKCWESGEEKPYRRYTAFKYLKEYNGDWIVDFVPCCSETECLKLQLSRYEMGHL